MIDKTDLNPLKSYLLVLLTSAVLLSCGAPKDTSKTIVKIGPDRITEAQIRGTVMIRPSYSRFAKSNREKSIKLLKEIIESKLLALAAKDHGLLKDSELVKKAESMQKRSVVRIYQTKFLEENGGMPTPKLEKYYNSHKSQFKDDSNRVMSFEDAKSKVVDSLLLKSANLDSFYTAEKSRYIKIEKKDSLEKDTILPPIQEKIVDVRKDYLSAYKQKLVDNMQDNLFQKFKVEFKKPKPKINQEQLLEYYNQNKKRYQTVPAYEIYHIQMEKKNVLSAKTANLKSLDSFKALAKKTSINDWTKKSGGYIGFVKKNFCLPYGIGMFPRLFPVLDSMEKLNSEFKMTAPMNNPQTQQWHVFAYTGKKDKEDKPFDRVRVLVKQDYIREKGESIAPDAILAVFEGNRTITEADVVWLRKEIPAHYQKRYTRKVLVDYLALWEVAYLEAKAIGLLSNIQITGALELESDEFWSQTYQDSILKDTYGLDTNKIKSVFSANKEYFFEKIDSNSVYSNYMNRDIAIFMSLNPKEFQLEYNLYPDKYRKDNILQPFSNVKYQIFQNVKKKYGKKPWEDLIAKLKIKYNVRVLDPFYLEEKLSDPVKTFKTAQGLHTDRKLAEALNQYRKIRSNFTEPKFKSLQDSVCMAIAQVYVEQEKYEEALSEYRRLLYQFPESRNNYKAQFMIGFIYSENLKKDNLAIQAFELLLEKYPDSDLADDADWMIRNIKSGGALMPTLEEG